MTARPFLPLMAAVWLGLLTAEVCAGQGAFFDEGNQRYQAGDFDGALERYAQILDDGLESGELYYNIGNTYFKLGKLGPAILYYERARRLMPGDGDLLANLELARSLTADEIAPLPGFWLVSAGGWWVGLVPRGALVWLVALAYLVAMTAVILVILRPATVLAAWGRRLAIAGATVTLVLGLNLAVRELGIGADEEAVIMAEETAVQSAPSDDSALQIFAVHEGTKVRTDRRSDVWIEIILEDGKVGWVRADQLEPICDRHRLRRAGLPLSRWERAGGRVASWRLRVRASIALSIRKISRDPINASRSSGHRRRPRAGHRCGHGTADGADHPQRHDHRGRGHRAGGPAHPQRSHR